MILKAFYVNVDLGWTDWYTLVDCITPNGYRYRVRCKGDDSWTIL